jgi:hypothetical protein
VDGADPGLSESAPAAGVGADPILDAETESAATAFFAAASLAEHAARRKNRSGIARIGAWGIWEGFGSG